MIKVFISSVSRGLEVSRDQVVHDLRTGQFDVLHMEIFGARDDLPLDTCLNVLRSADVVVVIIGPRYGTLTPAGDVSYTHEEFREARRRGIPVLAFVLDADPTLSNVEKAKLAAFAKEAGSSLTYDKVTPDRLSARILVALASARSRSVLGPSYRFFQSWEKSFRRQLDAVNGKKPLFNHLAPFVGRDVELKRLIDFSASDEQVILLTAPGGAGKSRLLLEAAKAIETPPMFFVDSGAEWNAVDIHSLPTGPIILVFDDAHRRADLDRVMAACLEQNNQIRFIVACRPSSLEVVRPHLSPLVTDDGNPTQIALSGLPKAPALQLAKSSLGGEFEHLAEQLIHIADNNPLVITVGGRCIAMKDVLPQTLDHTPEEFRDQVLERLLRDQAITPNRRRLLDVLSAIGPIGAEDVPTRELLAKFFETHTFDIAQELDALEESGFIQRRGRVLRIVPDVLADHLLYRASVDRKGHPTNFVDTMVRIFAPHFLSNILANGAELDWRAEATNAHEPVLKATWSAIHQELPQLTNLQRVELLKRLRRAARFAPERVIEIAEWLFDHPQAPKDEDFEAYGLEDLGNNVRDAIADILGFIASHPNFTARALARLWRYAEADERPTNPNPEHPRRRIQDLLKYDRHIHAQVQDAALDFVLERLSTPVRHSYPWAVGALQSVLARYGEANSSTSRAFTLATFSLSPYMKFIAPRRARTLDMLVRLAMGDRPDEAVMAVSKISELLRQPHGLLGHSVDEEEVKAWLPEALSAVGELAKIAISSPNLAIRYLARKALRGLSRKHWPEVGEAADAALRDTPALPNELLFDILAGMPWEEELDDWKAERERIKEACTTAAQEMWETWKTPEALVRFLLEARVTLSDAFESNYQNEWSLLAAIVTVAPDNGLAVIRCLVADGTDNAFRLVPPALDALHRGGNEAEVREFIDASSNSPYELLRARIADALRYLVDEGKSTTRDLEIIRPFLADESPLVRRAALRPLANFEKTAQKEALALLVDLEWDNDPAMGEAVCDVLHSQYALDPAALTDEQVDTLLARIERLHSLAGRSHDVLHFVAFASHRRPRQTVEMLLRRVNATAHHSGERGVDRWTPLPYSGHGLSLTGVANSPHAHDLARLVRDASIGSDPLVRFWLPTLFALVVPDPKMAIPVLREWVLSGGEEKLVSAAMLLREYEHDTIFAISDFVADLLEAASNVSVECLEHTKSELYSLAISGIYTSSPGKPSPRHLSLKAKASEIAKSFKDRPVARQFFDLLVKKAEESIKRETAEFDDGEEEAE